MSLTAIVLSAVPIERVVPGVKVHVHVSRIDSSASHQRAWAEAIDAVQTEHFIFLDVNDELPPFHADVWGACCCQQFDLVLTDELWIEDGGTKQRRRACPYSQAVHLRNHLLVHHNAVWRTAAARAALARCPVGHYWPEMLTAWEIAKAGPVAYVPLVAYHWRRRATGLHRAPWMSIGQTRTALWCKDNP